MTEPMEFTAPCPTCAGDATWRSREPSFPYALGPLTFTCPACDAATLGVRTEPPPPTAPRVSTALACIARRMLFGATA